MDIKKYCSMKMHGTKLVKKITRNRLPLEKSKKKNKGKIYIIYHIILSKYHIPFISKTILTPDIFKFPSHYF